MKKTWLITGCSSGLGRSLAKETLKQGYNVVVTARNTDTIQEIVDQYPQSALGIALDVTNQESIRNAVKQAIDYFGSIDILVNNAGYGYRSAIEEGTRQDISKLFETNVWGPVALIKQVLPFMRAKHQGAIINVSSIAAIHASMGSGYYAASKSALESISESLKKEVEPLGIKVMIVEPGAFRTNFTGSSLTQSPKAIEDYALTAGTRRVEKEKNHGKQPGNPDQAAPLIIQAIESEKTPLRLLLGSDAVNYAHDMLSEHQKDYDKWCELSKKTDYKKDDDLF